MTRQEFRKYQADFIREIRRDMPYKGLTGGWTRREWNKSVRQTARNTAENVEKFRRLNP